VSIIYFYETLKIKNKMKKFLIAACMMFTLSGIVNAQAIKKAEQAPAKVVKMEKAAKPAPTAEAPLKKDGTPDKRFKATKNVEPAGPVKKDGTPDKRYKANKKG